MAGVFENAQRGQARLRIESQLCDILSQRVMKPAGDPPAMAPVGMVEWGPLPTQQHGLGVRQFVQLGPDPQRIKGAEVMGELLLELIFRGAVEPAARRKPLENMISARDTARRKARYRDASRAVAGEEATSFHRQLSGSAAHVTRMKARLHGITFEDNRILSSSSVGIFRR